MTALRLTAAEGATPFSATGAEAAKIVPAGPVAPAAAAGVNLSSSTNVPASSPESLATLRTYLRLQEQLHSTMLAVEQARVEASSESRTNVDALLRRLESLEKTLADQRQEQLLAATDSNRTMVFLAAGILGIGVLAMAFTAIFQSRGMNRLAEIATGLSQERSLPGMGSPLALSEGERLLLNAGPAAGTQALRTTISRLEERIREMESATQGTSGRLAPRAAAGGGPWAKGDEEESVRPDGLLLAKGRTLLNLGKHDEALVCFEAAIGRAPDRAEAHLGRGQALERLRRLEEALTAYERAIELDGTLMPAYLGKGSVFNQQERYRDALECYEQALQTAPRG